MGACQTTWDTLKRVWCWACPWFGLCLPLRVRCLFILLAKFPQPQYGEMPWYVIIYGLQYCSCSARAVFVSLCCCLCFLNVLVCTWNEIFVRMSHLRIQYVNMNSMSRCLFPPSRRKEDAGFVLFSFSFDLSHLYTRTRGQHQLDRTPCKETSTTPKVRKPGWELRRKKKFKGDDLEVRVLLFTWVQAGLLLVLYNSRIRTGGMYWYYIQ